VAEHRCAHDRRLDLAQLEDQRGDDMVLFGFGLADEELPRLTIMVGECFRPL
jgi:hypothetical protein